MTNQKKDNTPPFSQEQWDWMLSLVAPTHLSIDSPKSHFVADLVKTNIRNSIKNAARKQGYLL